MNSMRKLVEFFEDERTPVLSDRSPYFDSLENYFKESESNIISSLSNAFPPSEQQLKAWKNTIISLKDNFHSIIGKNSLAKKWTIIFEYELPREGGRRPDVIILTDRSVFVIEVKDKKNYSIADIDQVQAYVRDIQEYHLASRDLSVKGILYLLKGHNLDIVKKNIQILTPKNLETRTLRIKDEAMNKNSVIGWMNSLYEPLPSLIQAAKLIFKNKPLPNIRKAQSAGIPEALKTLHLIVTEAKKNHDRRLVLISGAPGSGKTLVGLQFIHEFSNVNEIGVFLSGNGPLVAVLQDALKDRKKRTEKVFVQDVHRFIREHGIKRRPVSKEHVLIFDEAQRAWDKQKVYEWNLKKKNIKVLKSEPDLFIEISSQIKEWAVMIGLIGYGQEIYIGEEGGTIQWYDAVLASEDKWIVHCPSRLKKLFPLNELKIKEENNLDLTLSLRSHIADTIDKFVDYLLLGEIKNAVKEDIRLKEAGFNMLITKDIEKAKEYMVNRYKDESVKTYGIIASSKSKNLKNYGLDTSYYSSQVLKVNYQKALGIWFNRPNDPNGGCKSFEKIATEFHCQGLELDGVIIAWGKDLVWDKNKWNFPRFTTRNKAENPQQLRLNSYRVLLTRSRDGFVVYCPEGPEMKDTYQVLNEAGMVDLDSQ
jgi:DUF2075 family protein